VHVPGLVEGDRSRVALEAYPGLFARRILGNVSYKNDGKAKQTAARMAARKKLFEKIPMETSAEVRRQLVHDATGDSLDAVICALQAAWGWQRRRRNFGLPARIESCEGWIVSA